MWLSPARLYPRLRDRFHEARADLLVSRLGLEPGQRVLDLGGGDGEFAERLRRRVDVDVTVADPAPTVRRAAERGFGAVSLAPGRSLPFGRDAFDIVLCNSVIEHVTAWEGVGRGPWRATARRAQRIFAGEIRRVGRGYFVQTPHRHFPIDAHLWLPFTNWLPHAWLVPLAAATDRVWIKRCGGVDWELLTPSEMRAMFPEGTVVVERALGLPKSIVVMKRPRPS